MQSRTKNILLTVLLVLTLGVLCAMATVPPVNRDALTHHLLVPKLYLVHGGVYEIPQILFSYYPMNLDYLYMAAMSLTNDIIPAYVHMAFGLLTALLIFRYLHRRYSATWGLIGALFFLTLPVIVRLCTTAYVDLGVIFFTFAALLALLKWRDTGAKARWLLLAAVSCGLAMGTKYNGAVDFCILTAFVPVLYAGMKRVQFLEKYPTLKPRHRISDGVRALAFGVLFAVIALAVFSPWAVKNYVWTDNPIYPLAQGVFNPEVSRGKDLYGNEGEGYGMSTLKRREALYGEDLGEILLVPLRVFFDGQDNNPQYYDGRLSPALLIFSIIGLLFIRKRDLRYQVHDIAFISYAVIMVLLIYFLIDMRIRYIGTIIAPMTILTVVGLRSLMLFIDRRELASGRLMKGLVMAIMTVAFLGNYAYMAEKFREVEPLGYLTGKVSRDEYIAGRLREYPALQYLNANIQKGPGVFAVFMGNRMYYSDHFLTMDYQVFFRYVDEARSAADLAGRFEQDGYKYFLFNAALMTEFAPTFLESEALMRLDAFTRDYCEPVYSENEYLLFELKPLSAYLNEVISE